MKTYIVIPTPRQIWERIKGWKAKFEPSLGTQITKLQGQLGDLSAALEKSKRARRGGAIRTNTDHLNQTFVIPQGRTRPTHDHIRRLVKVMGPDWATRIDERSQQTHFINHRLNRRVTINTERLVEVLKTSSLTKLGEEIIQAAMDGPPPTRMTR